MGKSGGISAALSAMNSLMEASPVGVSILVYMELALAEKILASGRSCKSLRSAIMAVEFFT